LQAAPLLLAAKNGHRAIVELLLAVLNIDPDVKGGELGCTPLAHACKKGHVSIVQQLLARNDVDVNARGNSNGCTPLIMACVEGHVEIINLLLAKEGIDVNLVYGTAPIVVAATQIDVIKLLLDQEGIDVNRQDDSGTTALMAAAMWCNLESAKLLLERDDINVNISTNGPGSANGRGHTALHFACWQGSWEVANLILERDDIDLINPDLYRPCVRWGIIALEKKKTDYLDSRIDLYLCTPVKKAPTESTACSLRTRHS
jgi:ankyrin repeat protein